MIKKNILQIYSLHRRHYNNSTTNNASTNKILKAWRYTKGWGCANYNFVRKNPLNLFYILNLLLAWCRLFRLLAGVILNFNVNVTTVLRIRWEIQHVVDGLIFSVPAVHSVRPLPWHGRRSQHTSATKYLL